MQETTKLPPKNKDEEKSIFMCSDCGKQFKTKCELTHHINSKCGTIKLFTCKECGQQLMTAGSLYNHMLRHKGDRSFMCRFCAKQFLTGGQLKVHERIHTKEKAFVCEICRKGFCHRQSLITHSTLHTGIKPYQCENCGNAFSCVGNLLKHRKTHADTCGLVALTSHRVLNPSTKIKVKINTPESSKLKNKSGGEVSIKLIGSEKELDVEVEVGGVKKAKMELKKQTLDDDFIIEGQEEELFPIVNNSLEKLEESNIIGKMEISASELKSFIEDRALAGASKAKCKYCSKEYTQFKWLYKHEKDHLQNNDITSNETKNLPFKCSCCKKFFETKNTCREHQQIAHADILTCLDCDKIFANVDSLRSHRVVFHKGVPKKEYIYICEKCGKAFKQKSMLLIHNERNCKIGPFYKCSVCAKEFSSEHTRKAHMRIHNSAKLLLCKFCGKSFHWKGQLKVHERSHTGEKPYTCLFCPKSFAYRDSLLTHSSLHTGYKPHFCKGCGWRFSCLGNLMKHRVTHASTCGVWYQENKG